MVRHPFSSGVPGATLTRRWFLVGAAASIAGALLGSPRRLLAQRTIVHPDPRPGITGDGVLDPERFAKRPKVRRLYEMAREAPEIFDGLGCYCRCGDEHRSLLACFESEQPTGCHMCQMEAEEAHRLWKAGNSLAEIRIVLDAKWG